MQHNEFPKFVPDQVLMSEHLNQVFNYLDEQERSTRIYLIGIGIVCGLEVTVNAASTELTIAKGVGVTSEGYLIAFPETKFSEYAAYDPVKEEFYDRFVNIGTKTKKFDLYELAPAGTINGAKPLSGVFLDGKVVLLFVELLDANNKNCDPSSCDNKGVEVTVTFRPLLIAKADLPKLGSGGASNASAFAQLEELRLRRLDVPAVSIATSQALFEQFLNILDQAFLTKLEAVLSQAYKLFAATVSDLYPANPFTGLAAKFAFLYDGSLTTQELVTLQYLYDLFSDLLLTYDELRLAASEALALCYPDTSLFPRHLVLQQLPIPAALDDVRTPFTASPVCQCGGSASPIRALLVRLILLSEKFAVPALHPTSKTPLENLLRITPSQLGTAPLGDRAIPYYYNATSGPQPLYRWWNANRTERGEAAKNLSYHAASYNTGDEFVRTPLLYDLEPYNFLRIEGHIGQSYQLAVAAIVKQRDKYRLPFDVVALCADAAVASGGAAGLIGSALARSNCRIRDLESLYASASAEVICFLCKQMKFFYALTVPGDAGGPLVPSSKLLLRCDPAFRYAGNTVGALYEQWYSRVANQAEALFGLAFGAAIGPVQLLLLLMYYIEKLAESLEPAHLAEFDLPAFDQRNRDLLSAANRILSLGQPALTIGGVDTIPHLQRIVDSCLPARFESIVAEYQRRIAELKILETLAAFMRKAPGLEHKCGVTKGGTFVLVYHEAPSTKFKNVSSTLGTTSLSQSAANEISNVGQPVLLPGGAQPIIRGANLPELIVDIPDGAVIADFYLPYLCCSDCPCIQFIVPPPPATITIKPQGFCNADAKSYPVTVSPAGGVLSGEGTSASEDGTFNFAPAAVTLASTDGSKDVTLSYKTEDGEASTTVKVFRQPVLAFQAQPAAAPGSMVIVNNSQFASSYSWDFGDGSPADTSSAPKHTYAASGNYTIKLSATNGPCSASLAVRFSVQITPVRTCRAVKSFAADLAAIQQANLPAFIVVSQTSAFPQMTQTFQAFANLNSPTQADETKFHQDHKTAETLPKWLDEIGTLLIRNGDARTASLAVFRVLVDYTARIACYQDQDIDSATIPAAGFFASIEHFISALEPIIPNSSPETKAQLAQLKTDLQTESDRLNAQEVATKPAYKARLDGLLTLLKRLSP
jgi:hypothetical protein